MDILQLTYFKKIAELENVSKASGELLVAQPALSKVIRNLETELDAKLFDRVGKKIVLNENGKILLRHTNSILQHIDDAKSEIMDSESKMTGTVYLSIQAATRMLPQILLGFHQLHPTIKIVVQKQVNTDIPDNCDFYIFSSRNECTDKNTFPLLKEHCYVGMSKNHRLAKNDFVDMYDLKDEDFIILQEKKSLSDMLYEYCISSGFSPNIALECDQQSSVYALIENNMGIAFIPEKTWNISNHPDIVLKPIRNKESIRYINIRQKQDGYLSKMALLFKDYLIDFFSTL